jgi:hypothetical protein
MSYAQSSLPTWLMIDIVFNEEFNGVNETEITDYDGLRALGDEKVSILVQELMTTGLTSSGSSLSTNHFFLVLVGLFATAMYI